MKEKASRSNKSKVKKDSRSNITYPGLNKKYNLKIRQDLIDHDYLDKLSHKEKDWLSRFNEEYVSANFNHKGKRIHPKKYITKKVVTTGRKRKVDVFKKDCEDRNNWRNNDNYAISKCQDMLKHKDGLQDLVNKPSSKMTVEDSLIEMIDLKKKLKL